MHDVILDVARRLDVFAENNIWRAVVVDTGYGRIDGAAMSTTSAIGDVETHDVAIKIVEVLVDVLFGLELPWAEVEVQMLFTLADAFDVLDDFAGLLFPRPLDQRCLLDNSEATRN